MDLLSISSSIFFVSIVWLCSAIIVAFNTRARKSSKLPPGPYPVPLIGNILQLGPKPHRSLAELARKYGPVMSLKLGSITTVVISSPETARMVLQKHDTSFSSRAIPSSTVALRHSEFSMVWLPVENQGRKLRKICKEQMFSTARLDASQGLRGEKLQKLRDYVGECSEAGQAVDVGKAAFTTSLNLMSASLFSLEFARLGSDSAQEMKDVAWGIMKCIVATNFADYITILKSVDPQGISKQATHYFGRLFAIFDEIIEERLKSRGHRNDLLEALIDLNIKDEDHFTRNDINHLLLDLFVGGTDTTSVTVEWAMVELIRNPSKMSRLGEEVRNFIEENGGVEESDIPRLPYLQAVVKETFRLHPAAPFLVTRKADSDVEIKGYIVPRNAQILVNVWASGRDPSIWRDADEFVPERFLKENESVDFRGRDFELIPFGAGRRICPGLPLAYRMVHQMLVAIVGSFDWKLQTTKTKEMDMNENFGITLQKAVSLKAIPTKLRASSINIIKSIKRNIAVYTSISYM